MSSKALAIPGVPSLSTAELNKLVRFYVKHGAPTQDFLAGNFNYSQATIGRILQAPEFGLALDKELNLVLHRDGKSIAIGTLLEVAKDKAQAPQHRIRAAEILLSKTVAAAAPAPADDSGRDLAELSTDELRNLVDSMQQQLAERASPVNAPDAAPKQIDGEAISADSVFDSNG